MEVDFVKSPSKNAFLNKKQVLYTKLLKMLHELCIEYIYYYRTINYLIKKISGKILLKKQS